MPKMKVGESTLLFMLWFMVIGLILGKQIHSSNALNNELLLVRLLILIVLQDNIGRWSHHSSR